MVAKRVGARQQGENFHNMSHDRRHPHAGLFQIVVPPLPSKAWKRQMPFRGDEGIFEEQFIEDRRKGLETFVNKIAGHPLAQNERCLHMFLQEPTIDKNYTPGKVRNT